MSTIQRSHALLPPTIEIEVVDEFGESYRQAIAAERSLTVYLNRREIVTLMSLGADPEALVVGYLRNQGLITQREDLEAVMVDWEVEAAAVVTRHSPEDLEQRLGQRTVTTGCGQGTVFGRLLDAVPQSRLPQARVSQAVIYRLLDNLGDYNETYRSAGAVHGCALCRQTEVLDFVEDVGRHNAVDTLGWPRVARRPAPRPGGYLLYHRKADVGDGAQGGTDGYFGTGVTLWRDPEGRRAGPALWRSADRSCQGA